MAVVFMCVSLFEKNNKDYLEIWLESDGVYKEYEFEVRNWELIGLPRETKLSNIFKHFPINNVYTLGQENKYRIEHFFPGLDVCDVLHVTQNVDIEEDWDDECPNHPNRPLECAKCIVKNLARWWYRD